MTALLTRVVTSRTFILLAYGLLAAIFGWYTAVNPLFAIGAGVMLILVAATMRDATVMVVAFTFLTYFQTLVAYTGVLFSPIKITGLLLILTAITTIVWKRHIGASWRPAWTGSRVFTGTLLTLVLLGMASAGWASDISEVRQWSLSLITDVAILLSIGVIIYSFRQLALMLWALWAAGVVSTIWALLDPGLLVVGRLSGTLGDPNEYAAAGIVSITAGFVLMKRYPHAAARVTIGLGSALILYGVLQSQSRGGMLGLGMMMFVLAVTATGRERLRMIGSGLVVGGVFIAFLASPGGQAFIDRFEEEDSSGRTDLWRIATAEFAENPIVGVGLGNFVSEAKNHLSADVKRTDLVLRFPTRAHSFYLEWLAELGLVGGTLLAVFLLSALALLARGIMTARRIGHAMAEHTGRGLLAGLVGMLVCQAFISGQYMELLWIQLAMAPIYAAAVAELDDPAGQLGNPAHLDRTLNAAAVEPANWEESVA